MKKFLVVQIVALVVLLCSSINSFAELSVLNYIRATHFYTCMYNKPGEAAGLEYWATDIVNRGEEAVAESFVNCVELDIGAMNNAQFITRMYVMALNRMPDEEGLDYWIQRANSTTKGTLMREFIGGIINSRDNHPDDDLFANKVTVGIVYGWAQEIPDVCPTNYYSYLGVTEDLATVQAAIDQF